MRTMMLGLVMSGLVAWDAGATDLSPRSWGAGELEALTRADRDGDPQVRAQLETEGPVVGALLGRRAARAGAEALRQGGTAADAALTASLTEITLQAGRYISYAGIFALTYYDKATDRVYYLSSGYGVPEGETEPLTIPQEGTPSGRSVLVPGFMAGIEAAHGRFGRLPFASLFSPAIYFAEEGIPVDRIFAATLQAEREKILRLPEGRALFLKADGTLYQIGDEFKQLAVAETLRAVAKDGAAAMYEGAWGRAMVEAVRAEGGKIATADLARYRPIWTEPLLAVVNGYPVYTAGTSDFGGAGLLESLQTAEVAGLFAADADLTTDAERFADAVMITRATQELTAYPETENFPGLARDPAGRATRAQAERLWAILQSRLPSPPQGVKRQHSSAVVATDAAGNVAVVTHSINAVNWGSAGIFVGGVALPDSASFQQYALSRVQPGGHLSGPMLPTLVMDPAETRKPVFALSTIGGGLHEIAFQTLYGRLRGVREPAAILERPMFEGPVFTDECMPQSVPKGRFPAEYFAALALRGVAVETARKPEAIGYTIGLELDGANAKGAASLGLPTVGFSPL